MIERPAITQPCELAPAGLVLRSVLGLIDLVNPFLAVSQAIELGASDADRAGQIAALAKAREEMEAVTNAGRKVQWAGRYRPHVGHIPMILPAWDSRFPAADSPSSRAPIPFLSEHWPAHVRFMSPAGRNSPASVNR